MQQHTYAIMDRVEDSHWWFVGRRAILEGFLQRIAHEFRNPQSAIRILDVGCGPGANLEMLPQTMNRKKSNYITTRQLSLAQRLFEAGLLRQESLQRIRNESEKSPLQSEKLRSFLLQ